MYYLTYKKHDCTSATCTFNWNTLVTDNKQEGVGFLQSKQLPSLTASFSVSISNKFTHSLTYWFQPKYGENNFFQNTYISLSEYRQAHNSILNAYGQ